MEVGPTLVADGQAAERPEPGERALDHPAVPPQPGAALAATPSAAGADASTGRSTAAAATAPALAGRQLGRAFARPPPGPPDVGVPAATTSAPAWCHRGCRPRSAGERAGCRSHPGGRAASCPAGRDPSGSARSPCPLVRRGGCAVERGTAEGGGAAPARAVEEHALEPVPNARPPPGPPASVVGTSSPTRGPSRPAATPRVSWSARRPGGRSGRHGRSRAGGRPGARAAQAG